MERNWGRFTAKGGEAVEKRVTALVREAASAIASAIPADSYRAVILIGGYGRGEGGVERLESGEVPHNNLDFLLIGEHASAGELSGLKQRIDERLQPIAAREGIGLDVGATSVAGLQRSPCLVMWYDMRFGHKTILGDADFVPSLTQFDVQHVVPADIRNLLVNRGTLFVINDMLLEREQLSEKDKRTIVKHAVKGIIGYGDALLYFLGDYSWSYLEKQQRMRKQQHVPEGFRRLYDEAMEFRFLPHYEDYLRRDLAAWMEELRAQLAPVHLQCESMRLQRAELAWSDYAQTALAYTLMDSALSLRGWARKLRNAMHCPPPPSQCSMTAQLGFRASGMQGVLPIIFPLIAYRLDNQAFRDLGGSILHAPDTRDENLRRAYLKAWGTFGDINFATVLEKLGLSLSYKEKVS
ncbi:MAG: hypothetical protein R8K46_11220 [Mariprofundaceae bacterium]